MSPRFIALALAAALPACSVPRIPGITPYKIDIQQGNYISQEMASQLRAGMSKDQVRLTLGTPMLADAFHADRWDYVYWRVAPDGRRESRKMAVFFADGKLLRTDGDVIPLQKLEPATPPPASPAPATQSPVQPAPQDPAATPSAAPATPAQAPSAQETR